jgi:DNA/RNA-binding domain of Phe-tRNA-synthetase-like protein
MKFTLDPSITSKFSNLNIGYVIADIVNPKTLPFVEELKTTLSAAIKETYGIEKSNYARNPTLDLWRTVYEGFGVKPKTYPASVTSLVKRVVDGKGIWNISAVVDLYNCHSVMGLAPMGGYDVSNIQGDIVLRYGNEGETFLGLGAKAVEVVTPKQVVYADEGGVICWLWNHKDCQRTMITPDTRKALFFIDCADSSASPSVSDVLNNFARDLGVIGCNVLETGLINARNPSVIFSSLTPKKQLDDQSNNKEIDASIDNQSTNVNDDRARVSERLRNDEALTSINLLGEFPTIKLNRI